MKSNTMSAPSSVVHKREVSKIRWYAMKGIYLLTFLSLGYQTWETLLFSNSTWDPTEGVAYAFWGAYSVLMGIGIRYPLKMLPLLMLQLFYKSVWLLTIGYPSWLNGNLDAVGQEFVRIFLIAVVLDLLIIPWRYVYRTYFKNLVPFAGHRPSN